jgi:MoxR-like ATPase
LSLSPLDPLPAPAPASPALPEAARMVAEIRAQVGRAVIGQERVVELVLTALIAGGHVLVEGVPGLGKTLLVLAIARAIGGRFARVQFTPDLMPADVTGHTVFDSASGQFHIRRGPAFTNLLLADEINRAPAKTQAALLEVMQERQITIEGEPFEVPRPFLTLATQNPIDHEGTYPLPEAQLDRFLFKVRIDYPSHAEEMALVREVTGGKIAHELDVASVATVASPEAVEALQKMAAGILVDDRILDYAVRIGRGTRAWRGLRVGAGPRGAIALVRAARATALIAGRDYVVPDDVKAIALPTLEHRVIVSPEVEIEGQRAEHLVAALLEQVEAPRE